MSYKIGTSIMSCEFGTVFIQDFWENIGSYGTYYPHITLDGHTSSQSRWPAGCWPARHPTGYPPSSTAAYTHRCSDARISAVRPSPRGGGGRTGRQAGQAASGTLGRLGRATTGAGLQRAWSRCWWLVPPCFQAAEKIALLHYATVEGARRFHCPAIFE